MKKKKVEKEKGLNPIIFKDAVFKTFDINQKRFLRKNRENTLVIDKGSYFKVSDLVKVQKTGELIKIENGAVYRITKTGYRKYVV